MAEMSYFFPLPDILQMTFGLFKGVKYNVLTQYKNRAIDLICVYKDKAERNLEFYISHRPTAANVCQVCLYKNSLMVEKVLA